ncbi:hypothetical protein ACHAXH_001730 [Discostella pseudostelligera]
MSRIARRGIESTSNRCLGLGAACRRIRNCWCRISVTKADADEKEISEQHNNYHHHGDGGTDVATPPQYTLLSNRNAVTPKSLVPFPKFRQRLCFLCSRTTFWGSGGTTFICFGNVDKRIASFLSFTFRSSYFTLLLVFAIFYYCLVLVFALIYQVISMSHPECISSGGEMISSRKEARIFADCFQLSWQTFSTVGLGAIYPSTGADGYYVPTGCVIVGILGSFEAYLGVLYVGTTAAILFRKVLRSQNYAQAVFSDPIVVRFGVKELGAGYRHGTTTSTRTANDGLPKNDHDEELGDRLTSVSLMTVDEEVDADYRKIPCPSLEFRIVNRLHDVESGEIVEAKLDCVAILDPRYVESHDGDVDNAHAPTNRAKRVKQRSMPSMPVSSPDLQTSRQKRVKQRSSFAELASALREASKKAERDAFYSPGSKQPNVFTSITLEDNTHPNFNRTWYGRHRLDENSPLLTPAVRNRIKNAGGYWPADMNNYQSIKRSLHFRHILVCLSGISNANAATVYAQKVYDLVDVNVGYRFVPMNYHADDGSLKTDAYLLNAVCMQRGGGAEPFQ